MPRTPAGVAEDRLPDHLTGSRVERGIQRERAAADVFEPMPFGAAGGEGQCWKGAIEGLDRRLFVDAEDCRVLGRVHVEANHVGGLGLEIRVVGGHVAIKAMRLQTGTRPDPGHPHVADPEHLSQLAGTPVSAAIRRLLLGEGQDLSLQAL